MANQWHVIGEDIVLFLSLPAKSFHCWTVDTFEIPFEINFHKTWVFRNHTLLQKALVVKCQPEYSGVSDKTLPKTEQRQRNERGEIMEKQTIFDQSGTSGAAATPSLSLSACTSVSSPLSKAATAKAERVKKFQKLVSVRKRQSADASGFASFSASVKVGRRKSDGLPSSTAGLINITKF